MAPADVEPEPAATLRVLRDNCVRLLEQNKNLTEGRQRRLDEAGAFRAPTDVFEGASSPSTGQCGSWRATTR